MALWAGAACRQCQPGRCVQCPTPDDPLYLDAGDGPPIEVTSCPNAAIPTEARTAIRLAAFAERGTLPEPGGVLDQLVSGLAAIEFVWREQAETRHRQQS